MKKLIIASVATLTLGALALYADDAKTTWDKSCASCHGKEGKGDTKMGQKLEIRDFTDAKVQADLKDEEMAKAIKEGLKKDDKVKMKAYGDKLSDDDIKALVAYVRGLKK